MRDRLLDIGLGDLLRELTPSVLGTVTRRFRDFAAAEDAVQEALLAAASQWPRDGIPDNPRGWLIQVASRRMLDYLRSEVARRRREADIAIEVDRLTTAANADPEADPDDTLNLFFMCCHPSLTSPFAIALTLRALARSAAFLMPVTGRGVSASSGEREGKWRADFNPCRSYDTRHAAGK
jgi:predicted RNA polymerase sigma factor